MFSCAPSIGQKESISAYFFIYRDVAGRWRWKFVSSDNGILATGTEAFQTRAECESAIAKLKHDASSAETIDDDHFRERIT